MEKVDKDDWKIQIWNLWDFWFLKVLIVALGSQYVNMRFLIGNEIG